ncbi:protein kinase domain-containing protein [Polyangium sorediatum]|uniref:Protein kinase n=1 Tax=Polyangium sorediatum TaxID=889274 RepID=A0ABT6NN40_9BACT|nr:protein kinase [Polyangium sorediatum]MDI1429605.1 protein kinase [Polyangium sorediatum]
MRTLPAEASSAGEPREQTNNDATIGYTSEQSLWRAATVVAEHVEPLGTVSEHDGDVSTFLGPGKRYQIREMLGVGGMGEVHLCRDEAIGRDVAQKTLLTGVAGKGREERRFLREVRVQGQLEHPSVVPVYDMGIGADGKPYFTMRRVQGHTLAEVLRGLARGDASIQAGHTRRRLLEAFVRVCLAVDYAHTRGVLHRDLKPSNIMLGAFGEVYVLDWGVAKLVADRATGTPITMGEPPKPPAQPVTVPGAELARQEGMVGTLAYMSPEQMLGVENSQDARTDVYSLGAILYEILTLRPLHRGTREEITESTLRGADARASAVAPDVPPELDAICVRATSIERARRFTSARELCDTVERYLDGDRDLERRRELAAHHVQRAREVFERARRPENAGAAAATRAEAMREVIQALALDPEEADARALLVKLLLEPPEHLPPSVEAEMAESARTSRLYTARFGIYALVGWTATIPVVAWMGILDVWSCAAASVLCVLSALYAVWIWRSRGATSRQLIVLATGVAATCGALSCWLGPFVLTPTAAATTTIWFTLHAERRERWLVGLLGGLAIVVPFLLELVGWIPRSFSLEAGRFVLHARGVHLAHPHTTLALLYSSVTFTVLQPVLLGGLRDALSAAERKLFLQAWHLRQLAPTAGSSSHARR